MVLKRKIERLESKMRQPTRPHRIQNVAHNLIKKNPSDLTVGELDNKVLNIVKDESNGTLHLVIRIDGEIKKVALT